MAVSSTQLAAFRTRTRDLHNWLRKKRNGKTMLVLDSRLNYTALQAARWQASRDVMAHSGYYCKTFCTGCNSVCNYCTCSKAVGENVAGGWGTADSVCLQGWRYSCAHYYNMVNGGFNLMGVGVADAADGTRYWAVHLAGNRAYCGTSGGYTCACTSLGGGKYAWKSTDPWRCPGGTGGCP
jgi:uncharacterized protein YkwD